MATKAQALAVAKKYGFVFDESVTGKFGMWHMATVDHPTHSIGSDCRSIHEEAIYAADLWHYLIIRVNDEGSMLELCTNENCEYHNE